MFSSKATNLVPNDVNEWNDVFRYDFETQEIILVSYTWDEKQANKSSYGYSISGNGQKVAFSSTGTKYFPHLEGQ